MKEQALPLIPTVCAPAPEPIAGARGPEVPPADRVMQHYNDAISALIGDAAKSKTLRALVHVMTFNIARIIVDCGAAATGDVLERLGSDIAYFFERDRAAKEAEEAREAGRLPH